MKNRRSDLDWLRVTAFGLLILYHSGMAWSGWHWHLNSNQDIAWLREAMRFVNRWRMPLIFLVSGGAIVLALGLRSPGAFAVNRLRRLLLPLAFGMVVLVPPQVYAERHFSGQFAGSFLEWLPEAFRGTYPAGNLSWHHLWFVAYVLVLTFALLPCFLWARAPSGVAAQSAAARLMGRFGLHWLMALPLGASILWLAPLSHNTNGLIGDWHGLAYNGVLLLYGGFIFGTPEMLAALNRQRFLSLGIGIASYATLYSSFFDGAVGAFVLPADRPAYAVLSAVNTMAWLFTAIGFANRYLTLRPRFLGYASEAVYPFYMIHQTVTVIAVYWLLTYEVPPVEAFVLAVLATFGVTWAIYAWLVQPVAFLRPLFGLKAIRPPLLAKPAH
jgi:surface polysaccharide O-acyltransferase-like enzyme